MGSCPHCRLNGEQRKKGNKAQPRLLQAYEQQLKSDGGCESDKSSGELRVQTKTGDLTKKEKERINMFCFKCRYAYAHLVYL